mmetsp:Transcript_11932/g.30669  ORF Transcript_11932/g.30669 Transcript_11932/m.30669 type:complete len:215 (-) Transcript_11932:823-1467(-)
MTILPPYFLAAAFSAFTRSSVRSTGPSRLAISIFSRCEFRTWFTIESLRFDRTNGLFRILTSPSSAMGIDALAAIRAFIAATPPLRPMIEADRRDRINPAPSPSSCFLRSAASARSLARFARASSLLRSSSSAETRFCVIGDAAACAAGRASATGSSSAVASGSAAAAGGAAASAVSARAAASAARCSAAMSSSSFCLRSASFCAWAAAAKAWR